MNQIAKKSLIEKYTNDSRLKEIDRIFALRSVLLFADCMNAKKDRF